MKSAVLNLSKMQLPVGFNLNNLMTFFLCFINDNGFLLSSFVPFNSKHRKLIKSPFNLFLCLKLLKINFKQKLVSGGGLSFSLLTDPKTAYLYYRSVYNSIIGSFKFWFDELELVGLGYRLTLRGNTIRLRLGFSHVLILTVPPSVFLIKRKKRLLIYSTNRAALTHFISLLLRLRKMSVYKVKGIKKKSQIFTLKPGKKRAK